MQILRERSRVALGLGVVGLVAVLFGKLSAERPASAVKLVLVPILAVAVVAPAIPLVVAVGVLPFQLDLLGLGDVQVGASDVLLTLGAVGFLVAAASGQGVPVSRLRPILPAAAVYFLALLVAWVHLPTTSGLATIVQRVELVLIAIVVGAFLAQRGVLDRALAIYVASAVALSVTAIALVLVAGQQPETYLMVQKNPAGQAIANALLVVIFHRATPYRLPAGAILALGLVAAQSRGAILATVLALALATVLVSSSGRVRALAVVPMLLGAFYAAFSALPSDQQERLVTVAPGGDVATETRENYASDAIAKFRSAPVLGTGVGLYESGSRVEQTYTDDPHNVLLLELAEGGVVLGGGFVALTLSSWWVLTRRRRAGTVVIAALAVQVATVLHGVVDIYWVRGTPVLGWVLVGAALYLAHRDDEVPERTSAPPVLAGDQA